MRDSEAEALVRTWALCGGRERRFLPSAGGLSEQDAGTMTGLELVDALLVEADAREARRVEAGGAAPARGGR